MKSERMETLEGLLKSGISPILLENFPASIFTDAVVLDGTCSKEELTGHYEEITYSPPEWYKKLMDSSKQHTPVLIIKDINKIPEEEQRKFIELFKYRKVYVHKLPENCMIFATYSNLEERPIQEELYSFMVHI